RTERKGREYKNAEEEKLKNMAVKVLMVCLGNICRSPMAHGLLQHKVQQLKLGWEVDSAGTSGYHEGQLPDPRATACMKQHGIDITYQRSRPISYEDLKEYDLVYVMDKSNYKNVTDLARTEEEIAKVKMIMSEVNPNVETDVPDPYYGGDKGFENVYKMLDKATDKIVERYK
ncbi:MAG: protein-tyrosine-phosphatase, partial [Bacteroidota bacterium]|nr:protein-tyrosine-phosphatase [Bacteroidota bacterium]